MDGEGIFILAVDCLPTELAKEVAVFVLKVFFAYIKI